jgi:hypothetical protein
VNNRKRVKEREAKENKREGNHRFGHEVKIERKQMNFYAKAKEIKRAMFSN